MRAFTPVLNNRGVALVFMVLVFTAVATAAVMFVSLGIRVRGIGKEEITRQHLEEIRSALQNYYLIHYDLPDPSLTTPVKSVPTAVLGLPQRYRFDDRGQLIRYDRLPAGGHMTTVRNVAVHGHTGLNMVAAVLVAPGPDGRIAPNNMSSPYGDPADPNNDDVVLAVSLEVEALKVASHTVAVLQQAAKAYDSIFYGKNNDLDTLYYPPETRWVDDTPPVHQAVQYVPAQNGSGTGGYDLAADGFYDSAPLDPVTGNPTGDYDQQHADIWYPNYAGEAEKRIGRDGTLYLTGNTLPDDDETVQPYDYNDLSSPNPDGYLAPRPEAIIDEDGFVSAQGGAGSGCVRVTDTAAQQQLSNDPDRGVATLDDCRDPITLQPRDPAMDLAYTYGLNLIKLGYDAAADALLDPWGTPYLWGAAAYYGGLTQSNTHANDVNRNFHYWSFFSVGPDGARDTGDDILPSTDRVPGYYLTPPISNPIP